MFKYSGKLRASNEIPSRSGEGFVVAIGCPIWSFYVSFACLGKARPQVIARTSWLIQRCRRAN